MPYDIAGEIYAVRIIKGQSEVAVKVLGGKVIRFPIDDEEIFHPMEPVKIRLIRE